MKFLAGNALDATPMMRVLLLGLQLFSILFLCFDMLYKFETIGLSYAAVHTYLFGDEVLYIDAVLLSTLLELLHADTFFAMMILLALGSIYARLCPSKKRALYALHTVMIAALLAIVSLPAALYVGNIFIGVWSVSFVLWHLGAVLMALEIVWRLRR